MAKAKAPEYVNQDSAIVRENVKMPADRVRLKIEPADIVGPFKSAGVVFDSKTGSATIPEGFDVIVVMSETKWHGQTISYWLKNLAADDAARVRSALLESVARAIRLFRVRFTEFDVAIVRKEFAGMSYTTQQNSYRKAVSELLAKLPESGKMTGRDIVAKSPAIAKSVARISDLSWPSEMSFAELTSVIPAETSAKTGSNGNALDFDL